MYEKFGQFIDGKWQQAEKKETYDVINPATEEVIGKASKASSIEVQKALKSAEKGLEVWKNTAPWQRAYVLRKIADMMRDCLLYTSPSPRDTERSRMPSSA